MSVEKVARAIAYRRCARRYPRSTEGWRRVHVEEVWTAHTDEASDAIAAMRDDKAELVATLKEIEQHMRDGDDTGAYAMVRTLIRKQTEA